ncbi:hypothetical protein [Streptomyces sp. NPDC056661]|uniref:hypothetical protein n=1 Tax=Streptomyces sp. NPDC056661 TaxID=3345898 RepID=UPI0036BCA858
MGDQGVEERLFALAAAGSVEELMAVLLDQNVSVDSGEAADEWAKAAYKWLNVASDYGYGEADEMIDDVLEYVLRHDGDNFVTGCAHFELAVSYLIGSDGLPVDFEKAQIHLEEMLRRGYPDSLQDGNSLLDEARVGMNPEAQQVFDAALVSRN